MASRPWQHPLETIVRHIRSTALVLQFSIKPSFLAVLDPATHLSPGLSYTIPWGKGARPESHSRGWQTPLPGAWTYTVRMMSDPFPETVPSQGFAVASSGS